MALSDYDKQVREAGYNYIPRTEFLLSPFKIPESKPIVDTGTGGIPTLIPRDSGDGFNPYNTDMSTIRQDFNPYEARQAEEVYSRTFNPRSLPGPQMPDELGISTNTVPLGNNRISASQLGINLTGGQVRNAYNRARNAMNMRGDDTMSRDYPEFTAAEVARLTNDSIQDYRQNYGAQGQYVDPYDPKYSSMAEAQQFMNMNNPEYYGMPSYEEETGIPAAIRNYMQNSLIGKGLGAAKGFVENILPFNERAVLEDQARAAGIYTDDIGRIVTDDYNTAGGIMAGYNLNQIDADTFDKRRQTIMENMSDRINPETGKTFKQERLDLLDEAEEDILGARKKTKLVKKLRKDKKVEEKRQREEAQQIQDDLAAAAAAKSRAKARAAIKKQGEADYNPNIHGQTNYGRDSKGNQSFDFGGGFGIGSDGGPVSNRTGSGRTGFMDGGRIYYMDGGLADLVDIYD